MTHPFPTITRDEWRARVNRELAGDSFEKLLVQRTSEGLPIEPLYTELPAHVVPVDPRAQPFRICMRYEDADGLAADIGGGADAIWLPLVEVGSLPGEVLAVAVPTSEPAVSLGNVERAVILAFDPIAAQAPFDRGALVEIARLVEVRGGTSVMVSTLAYHDAGAEAGLEVGLALATGRQYLEWLLEIGLGKTEAARQIAFQVAVGRDTFLELAKLRALRTAWQKILSAAGIEDAPRPMIHAVCSSRTLSIRDPWVNMLRVTTQVFAAVLGGADLVTPVAFDEAAGPPSLHGRRVARNTGLVLREESFLGKVIDPAGGSYYLETLTDAFAREGWSRFREIEKAGGIVAQLESGAIAARLAAAWKERVRMLVTRRVPVLGVSDFANLGESLPAHHAPSSVRLRDGGLPAHRDAEVFEALRAKADVLVDAPSAALFTVGPLPETRARVGFAASFFGAGGIAVRETASMEQVRLACLCGTDERYASEGADRIRALKRGGCERVLVAGRPGALESSLREAGADGFIFVGCDAVAILNELLGAS